MCFFFCQQGRKWGLSVGGRAWYDAGAMKNWAMGLGLLLALLPGAVAEEVERVLMIGNSYTFYNHLPEALMALSQKTECPMEVDSYTVGAMSLRGFLDSPEHAKARQMLERGDYDWVVLQDQSQTPAYKPEETLNSVRRWAQLAKAHKTRVMLFLTWAHASNEGGRIRPQSDMQEKTSATYCRAAVGEAWARWYRKPQNKPLHVRDCSHPNEAGTFLAACVLHGAMSGKALRGIPATLKLGRKVVLRVPGGQAAELQKTANATLKGFTPEKLQEKQAKRDAALPSAEEVKAVLKKGTTLAELQELLGKPFYSTRQNGQRTSQFKLRGGAELCAYCSAQGTVRQVSITSPGSMVDIIDLEKL